MVMGKRWEVEKKIITPKYNLFRSLFNNHIYIIFKAFIVIACHMEHHLAFTMHTEFRQVEASQQ